MKAYSTMAGRKDDEYQPITALSDYSVNTK